MKRMCALALSLLLFGCSDMSMPEISNPFASSTQVTQVFYDEFPDVPIPSDMSVDRSRSLVSVTPEGVKIGLVTAEGRYEMASLTAATIHNMNGQGWTLRSVVNGPRVMQVYEKDNRVAAIYFYPQTASVAMEQWVALRLPDGMLPTGGAGASSATPYSSQPQAGYGNTGGAGTTALTQ